MALHIYLDDVSDCGGPTVFVPADSSAAGGDPAYTLQAMTMMPGVAGHPRYQSRQHAEEYFGSVASRAEAANLRHSLYERESGVRFAQGTVVLYQLGVWHRGTPVTAVRQQPQANVLVLLVAKQRTLRTSSCLTQWLAVACRDGDALPIRSCSAVWKLTGSSAALVSNDAKIS